MKYTCRMKVDISRLYFRGIDIEFKFIPEGKFFARYKHEFSINLDSNSYDDKTKFKIRYMELQEIIANTEVYVRKILLSEIERSGIDTKIEKDYLEIQMALNKLAKCKFEVEV